MKLVKDVTPQMKEVMGGDPLQNTQKYLSLISETHKNLLMDIEGPGRYEKNLQLETVSYVTEYADNKREAHVYPPDAQELIAKNKHDMKLRGGIIGAVIILLAVLFMIFSPFGVPGVVLGLVGLFVLLGALTFALYINWRTFKEYLHTDYLYKLPDSDFVSEDERQEFITKCRKRDAELTKRLNEMAAEADAIVTQLSPPSNLYIHDAETNMALLEYQSALDGDGELADDFEVPDSIQLIDFQPFRDTRLAHSKASSRVLENLSMFEVLLKTVADHAKVRT